MSSAIPPDVESLLERPGPGPHRITIDVGGSAIETLADLPPLRDRLLFVGLNPSPVSVEAGHYFQGRLGQLFWRRLIAADILPDAETLRRVAHIREVVSNTADLMPTQLEFLQAHGSASNISLKRAS